MNRQLPLRLSVCRRLRPIVEESSSVVYQFSGRGYASVPQVRYSPERLSITFQFKSFWKDAILFYTANNKTVGWTPLPETGGIVLCMGIIRGFTGSPHSN